MFFKKPEKQTPQSPAWFKWLMGLFILYALLNYATSDKPSHTLENIKATDAYREQVKGLVPIEHEDADKAAPAPAPPQQTPKPKKPSVPKTPEITEPAPEPEHVRETYPRPKR